LPYVAEALGPTLERLRPEWPVSIQWALQPFELFGLAAVPDLVMLAMTEPERYRKVCDHIREVNIELLREVFKAGADFVFLGGPGREMMSPKLYEEYMVPDSQKITAAVHEAGGLVYSHICSPIEPFLTQGYYSQMGIDLFETLSPPPVGNVEDLAEARRILPEEMCTRGNVGLDILLNGTVEDVEKATLDVLEATKGYKHMVAASDYLFYDIPLENARAVVRTVENYGK
jgi:uroporphyrinogen-III decarboxylase